MPMGPLFVLLGEVHVLCPFFNWIFCPPGIESHEFRIYFGDQALAEVLLANVFSHTLGSLSILIIFS